MNNYLPALCEKKQQIASPAGNKLGRNPSWSPILAHLGQSAKNLQSTVMYQKALKNGALMTMDLLDQSLRHYSRSKFMWQASKCDFFGAKTTKPLTEKGSSSPMWPTISYSRLSNISCASFLGISTLGAF